MHIYIYIYVYVCRLSHTSLIYVGMRPDIYYKDDKVTFTFRLKAFICTICFMIVILCPHPAPVLLSRHFVVVVCFIFAVAAFAFAFLRCPLCIGCYNFYDHLWLAAIKIIRHRHRPDHAGPDRRWAGGGGHKGGRRCVASLQRLRRAMPRRGGFFWGRCVQLVKDPATKLTLNSHSNNNNASPATANWPPSPPAAAYLMVGFINFALDPKQAHTMPKWSLPLCSEIWALNLWRSTST